MDITSGLYLTHYELGLLAQALLSSVMLIYCLLLKDKLYATRLLTRYLVGLTLFMWSSCYVYSGLAMLYRLNALLFALVCHLWSLQPMMRFAYYFPVHDPAMRREIRVVTRLSFITAVLGSLCGGYALFLWESYVQPPRTLLLYIQGLIAVLALQNLWIFLVFCRRTARLSLNQHAAWWSRLFFPQGTSARATRAVVFLFLGIFATFMLRIGQNAGLISPMIVETLDALLPLMFLFQLLNLYVTYSPEPSTVLVKIVGSSYVMLLSVLGLIGFWVGSGYQADYRPAFPFRSHSTLHFAPADGGGYRVAHSANAFDPQIGEPVDVSESPRYPLAFGFSFPCYDAPWTAVSIYKAGWVSLTNDALRLKTPPRRHLPLFRLRPNEPAIAPLLMNLTAAPDGGVFYNTTNTQATITWKRMLDEDGGVYTFQLRLYQNGAVDITYQEWPESIRYDAENPLQSPMLTGIFPAMTDSHREAWTRKNGETMTHDASAGALFWFYYADFRETLHRQMLPLNLIMLAFSAVLLIGFPLYFRSFLLQPLYRLRDGVSQMETGRLDVALDVASHDELGSLTQTFNRMASSMAAAAELLQEDNRLLEQRIAERTAMLRKEIAERQAAEKALQASETEYRLLFENLQDIFIRVDEAGILRLISPSIAIILGYLPEKLIGKPITDTIIAQPEEWRQCVAAIRAGGAVGGFELRLRYWDGSLLWGSISAQMYQPGASGAYVFEGTIRDISERKRAEAELQAKNADLQETLTHLQAAQQELIQAEKMAALGKLIANVAHEINTPLGAIQASARTIITALDETFLHLPEVIRLLSDDEQNVFIRLILRACQPKQTLTSREERRHRRALCQTLEAAAIAEADTIADTLVDMGISEEIAAFTPLFRHEKTLWLLGAAANIAAQRHSSENILFAVERMSKIVFALKSYAHSDASGQPTLARIQDGMEVVLTLYHNQLKHGIEVVKRYDDIPPISCYPDELNQVWTNLIHNAIQAMQGKGRLEITVKPTPCPSEEGKPTPCPSEEGKLSTPLLGGAGGGSWVVVEITDSGGGIPPEIADRIFEPFFTTKPAGEGSGLGLDICRKIIDKHQGKIEFDSQPGRTTFRVWLPQQ